LERYITNIGNVVGKEYSIEWEYIEDDEPVLADTATSESE
jgi:hypothetical protein